MGKLVVGPDIPKIIDLLEILERNINRLRKDLLHYESTEKKPTTTRSRDLIEEEGWMENQ